ncbi:MAG: putative Ig domain-containing protein [Gemmatimonadota bacterium]
MQSRWLILGAALCSVLLPDAGIQAQEPVIVSGQLEIVWGDPPSGGDARIQYFLRDDAGNSRRVDIDDTTFRVMGGLPGIRNQRFTATLDPPTAAPATASWRVRTLSRDYIVAPPSFDLAQTSALSNTMVSRPYVTVLCRFADAPNTTPAPKEHYEQLMGAAYPGVNHYWTEVTEGLTDLAGSIVVGWYTMASPRASYLNADSSANLTRLQQDCMGAADADVHFPSYSGVNLQFNQRLDCCSWGGSRTVTIDGVTRLYPMTWEADWATNNAGTYAHEVGHSLGLPHSGGPYGHVYDSRFDVMSASSWYPVPGSVLRVGSHTNGYHKTLLGVIRTEQIVVATGAVTNARLERSAQPRANSNSRLLQIPISAGSGEYYTVEARTRSGYDTPLANEGLVIHLVAPRSTWNVVSSVIDVDGNRDPNDAAASWTVGEVFDDVRNGISISVDSITNLTYHVTVRRSPIATLGLSLKSTTHSVPGGSGVVVSDSASLSVDAAASWTAWARARRIRMINASGTGPTTIRWQSETAGLTAGTYVDTVIVTAPGMIGSPARIIDTLQVTAPAELRVGASSTFRVDSLLPNRNGVTDSVRIRFTGPGAATLAWTVSRKLNGTSITSATAGIGDHTVRWFHSSIGRAAGVYVDTITVNALGAAGSPLLIVDTLRVFDPPVLTAERPGRSYNVTPEGGAAPDDSIRVRLSDRWANAGGWAVTFPRAPRFVRLRSAGSPRVGNGGFAITRSPGSLAPGIYVDSIRVTATIPGGPNIIVTDTLEVQPAPAELQLSWNSRSDSVRLGSDRSRDSVQVLVFGPASGPKAWSSTTRNARITLFSQDAFTAPGAGTGTQWLRYSRNLTGRITGTYVDTITITVAGLTPQRLIDTLRVTGSGQSIAFTTQALRRATMGYNFADTVRATSVAGAVQLTLLSALPAGLVFNAATGVLSGIPTALGLFNLDFRAVSASGTALATFSLTIGKPALAQSAVVNHVFGRGLLNADQARFVDLLGNRNGRVDVGDLRAWLIDAGIVSNTRPATADSRRKEQP